MGHIVKFQRLDEGSLDATVLRQLELALGEDRSREVLAQACCDIIEKLTQFELAFAKGDARAASRLAHGISALSGEIGLTELGLAAREASACALGEDAVARAATAHRMIRVGEASLDMLLSHQDAS